MLGEEGGVDKSKFLVLSTQHTPLLLLLFYLRALRVMHSYPLDPALLVSYIHFDIQNFFSFLDLIKEFAVKHALTKYRVLAIHAAVWC